MGDPSGKQPRNLLSLPSVLITCIGTLIVTLNPVAETYFETGEIDKRALGKVAYLTLVSTTLTIIGRYNETPDEPIYTPNMFPGRNRADVESHDDWIK